MHERTRLQRSSRNRGCNSRIVSDFWSRAAALRLTAQRSHVGNWAEPYRGAFLILFFTWAESTIFSFFFLQNFCVALRSSPERPFYSFPHIYLNVISNIANSATALWPAWVLMDLLLLSSFPGWDHFHPAVYFHFSADTTYGFMQVFLLTLLGSIISFTMPFSGLFQHKTALTANSKQPSFLFFSTFQLCSQVKAATVSRFPSRHP